MFCFFASFSSWLNALFVNSIYPSDDDSRAVISSAVLTTATHCLSVCLPADAGVRIFTRYGDYLEECPTMERCMFLILFCGATHCWIASHPQERSRFMKRSQMRFPLESNSVEITGWRHAATSVVTNSCQLIWPIYDFL